LNVNVEKLRTGEYLLQNFAMFLDTKMVENPFEACMGMIDCYYQELRSCRQVLAPAFTYEGIMENQRQGKISAMLTIEDGAVLKGSMAFLRIFYRLGVRMMTLTWNYPNELGYPNAILEDQEKGLTQTGLAMLDEMERLGMIVDVSHLSDGGFWSVCRHARKPFVASHSNARAMTGHRRNLTDEMIRALAERGGVTGLNFYAPFLNSDTKPYGRLSDMVRHSRHITDVGGIECLGLGTDFDSIGDEMEVHDAGQMGLLWDAMKQDGFTEQQLDRIFGENVLRVYREIL
jgi:membrane dipeptidase